jgi:hypothetical protein
MTVKPLGKKEKERIKKESKKRGRSLSCQLYSITSLDNQMRN